MGFGLGSKPPAMFEDQNCTRGWVGVGGKGRQGFENIGSYEIGILWLTQQQCGQTDQPRPRDREVVEPEASQLWAGSSSEISVPGHSGYRVSGASGLRRCERKPHQSGQEGSWPRHSTNISVAPHASFLFTRSPCPTGQHWRPRGDPGHSAGSRRSPGRDRAPAGARDSAISGVTRVCWPEPPTYGDGETRSCAPPGRARGQGGPRATAKQPRGLRNRGSRDESEGFCWGICVRLQGARAGVSARQCLQGRGGEGRGHGERPQRLRTGGLGALPCGPLPRAADGPRAWHLPSRGAEDKRESERQKRRLELGNLRPSPLRPFAVTRAQDESG